jgi:hypothetical protein
LSSARPSKVLIFKHFGYHSGAGRTMAESPHSTHFDVFFYCKKIQSSTLRWAFCLPCALRLNGRSASNQAAPSFRRAPALSASGASIAPFCHFGAHGTVLATLATHRKQRSPPFHFSDHFL